MKILGRHFSHNQKLEIQKKNVESIEYTKYFKIMKNGKYCTGGENIDLQILIFISGLILKTVN